MAESEIERGRALSRKIAPFAKRHTFVHELFTQALPVIVDPRVPEGEPREVTHARPGGFPALIVHPADFAALRSYGANRQEHLGPSEREKLWERETTDTGKLWVASHTAEETADG